MFELMLAASVGYLVARIVYGVGMALERRAEQRRSRERIARMYPAV